MILLASRSPSSKTRARSTRPFSMEFRSSTCPLLSTLAQSFTTISVQFFETCASLGSSDSEGYATGLGSDTGSDTGSSGSAKASPSAIVFFSSWTNDEITDDSVASVGTEHSAGKMSPHRMLTTSVADENRLFTQMRGKTIGIAIKDRGAILPAGHTANAAYWFHGKNEGVWITSTFYRNDLPKWVEDSKHRFEKSISRC